MSSLEQSTEMMKHSRTVAPMDERKEKTLSQNYKKLHLHKF